MGARDLCCRCYKRSWRAERRVAAPPSAPRPEPEDKVAYLGSLSEAELAAYCAGVLSHASANPGDPVELERWSELVRLTSDRLRQAVVQ